MLGAEPPGHRRDADRSQAHAYEEGVMGDATTLVRVTDSLYVRAEDVRSIAGAGDGSQIITDESYYSVERSPKAVHDRLNGHQSELRSPRHHGVE